MARIHQITRAPLNRYLKEREFHLLTTLLINGHVPSTEFINQMTCEVRQGNFPNGSWILERQDENAGPEDPSYWIIVIEQCPDNEKNIWTIPKTQSNPQIRATLTEDYGLKLYHPPNNHPPHAA